LRIIPGASRFLVSPNNISRSSAVVSILLINPGGPVRSLVSMSGVFPTGLGKVIGGGVGSVMPGGNDFYYVLGRKLIEAIEWV
jgi:hypothetical protein